MAHIAAQTVVLLQANAAPDAIADELAVGADFHYHVHQAAGIVAVQLGTPVGHALVRLRAHAFGNGRRLTDVAYAVIDHMLRLRADDT